MDNFDFVQDRKLKKNLVDSIRYMSFLWVWRSKRHGVSQEVFRTIILYSASIVEALLLDYCKRKDLKFFELKYSKDYLLPKIYQSVSDISSYNKGEVVLAIRHKVVKKNDGKITFSDLIAELGEFLGNRLIDNIKQMKDIRNTLHLCKSRDKLTTKDTEKAIVVILKTINKIRKS